MADHELNCLGMKCPQPVLKVAVTARKLQPGTTLRVIADCPSFASDIQKWCDKNRKTLMGCMDVGGGTFEAEILF